MKVMDEIVNKIREYLGNIKKCKKGNENSPHKLIFILALIEIYEEKGKNRFVYDDDLNSAFLSTWHRYFKDPPYTNALELPFYHLTNDGFWMLSIKNGMDSLFNYYKKEKNSRFTKKRIEETIEYGYFNGWWSTALKDTETRSLIKKIIDDELKSSISPDFDFEKISSNFTNKAPNPFIAYLNSLHSKEASNENALAEFQACNPFFSKIYVRHPLVNEVLENLMDPEKGVVILTGHAGDGKSTIALSVYKEIKGINETTALEKPINNREDVTIYEGRKITIVKDLSEWTHEKRYSLISEIIRKENKWLVISNTGALLDALCAYAEKEGLGNRALWEPLILEAIDKEMSEIKIQTTKIVIINMAMQDNLSVARRIFERILEKENWNTCEHSACASQCPIYRNIMLLRDNNYLAIDRIFLAYRRMYEYGTRLTLRQIMAHIAYMITAGLNYEDIKKISETPEKPMMSEFLFFNRFFGDNGTEKDKTVTNMRAVSQIAMQGFGIKPCPSLERHLWLLKTGSEFPLGVDLLEKEFNKLRYYGAQPFALKEGISPDHAREQVRRIIFFLYCFKDENSREEFLRQFLCSNTLLKWVKWQNQAEDMSLDERNHMHQSLFRVLQEHYAGISMPEYEGQNKQPFLYLTLGQKKRDVRQSVQVVMAKIDFWESFKIILVDNKKTNRRDIVLKGHNEMRNVTITLDIPFLDYVMARNQGEIAGSLKNIFALRLERLKSDMLRASKKEEKNDLLLVRLMTDHSFNRLYFSVRDGKLEVSNG